MKTICDYHLCTGCGLCVSLCPVSCISMKSGKLGHLYPRINEKACVECSLCIKRCPVLNPIDLHTPCKAYAAWAKDESDYKSSTSGGASSVLSQFIIQNGGIVYGCAVLPGAVIEHVRIEKQDELFRIKGSKYVQSSIEKVLPLIKKDIIDKRTVLFLGTPCQIASVRKLFPSVPENLYLVDLICHGTPSQQSLHSYLRRHVQLRTVDGLTFRSEEGYIIKAFSEEKVIYKSLELRKNRYEDYYYNAFMDGFSFRDSCYHCRYASPQRGSDITIGDFWGLGKEASCEGIPEHKFGISVVLPNTDKGFSLFHEVIPKMNVFERPVSEAINGNDNLRNPKKLSGKGRAFRTLQSVLGEKGAYELVIGLGRLRKHL